MRELLKAGTRRVHEVICAEGNDPAPILEEIADLARAADVAFYRVSAGQLGARAATEAPQGVLARADPLPEHRLEELISRPGVLPFLVVFDGVTDPHNLGAVLRSALGAGASGAIVPRHRSAQISPTVAKAAAGAIEYLPIVSVPGIGQALAELSRQGIWTVGLEGEAKKAIEDVEVLDAPLAIVLGAEGRGLSALSRTRCDVLASIPLLGPIESLNVSAAAAVALFAVARRRSRRS